MSTPTEELATQLADSLYDGAEILSKDDLSPEERAQVPPWWLDAIQLDDTAGMELALRRWDTAIPGRLADTRDLFLRTSAGVRLARLHRSENIGGIGPAIALVYALHNESDVVDEPFACWYGHPTRTPLTNKRVDLSLLPSEIRAFYTQVHDYFHPAGFGSTGFIESDAIFPLDGEPETWEFRNNYGYIPNTTRMVPIFLDDTKSVCIELGNPDDDTVDGWLLYGGELVRRGPMWDVIDQRIVETTQPTD